MGMPKMCPRASSSTNGPFMPTNKDLFGQRGQPYGDGLGAERHPVMLERPSTPRVSAGNATMLRVDKEISKIAPLDVKRMALRLVVAIIES